MAEPAIKIEDEDQQQPDRPVNKDWFVDRLRSEKKSLRGLSRHLEIDASAVSRMFSGKRDFRMDEIEDIARFLNAPVAEILRHAGLAIDETNVKTGFVLSATINKEGKVERLKAASPLPESISAKIQAVLIGITGPVVAAQVRAPGGAMGLLDDVIVLFQPTDQVEADAIGNLSIARLMDGNQYICRIQSARKTGEATLRIANGQLEDVKLATAAAILAIIP